MTGTEPRARVLLVDDAEDLRALGTFVLLHAGYEVMIAASAGDALTLLEISDPPPDVIVLDVQMPDLDGWSTLEHIRANPATAHVPVLMCTVKTAAEDEDRMAKLRPDAHLSKPYSITELEDAVRSLAPGADAERAPDSQDRPVGCGHGPQPSGVRPRRGHRPGNGGV